MSQLSKSQNSFSPLDLLLPRQNSSFSSISAYLTQFEIESLHHKHKILTPKQNEVLNELFVAGDYSNCIRDLVERAKFYGELAIVDSFCKLIVDKLLINSMGHIPKPDIIVPIPPDPKRFIERGYHVPSLLAHKVALKCDVPYAELMFKHTHTVPQIGLSRRQRMVNLKGSFQIMNMLPINIGKYTNVYLIDDLTTTGSTLYEAALTLKSEFPFLQIYGFAVAGN